MRYSGKAILLQFVKFAVVGGLLYWLAKNGFLSFRETARALDHPFYLALGFVLNAVTVLIVGYRWYGLLHAQEILVPFRRVISLGFVGLFFNIALPGAVTGDLVKGYYLAKDASGREARAAGTILLDRMLGVGALVLVCAGAMAFANFPMVGPLVALRTFVFLLAVCVLLGVVYLLAVPPRYDVVLVILERVQMRFPRFAALREFYLGIRYYHHRPAAFLYGLFLSVINHLVVGAIFYSFGLALEESVSPSQVYSLTPLGVLVTTIPVAPAGVGTGHAAFAWLFGLAGSPRGADVYTLFVITQLLVGAVGGIIYLGFKKKLPVERQQT